jgi:hypothetical protein
MHVRVAVDIGNNPSLSVLAKPITAETNWPRDRVMARLALGLLVAGAVGAKEDQYDDGSFREANHHLRLRGQRLRSGFGGGLTRFHFEKELQSLERDR